MEIPIANVYYLLCYAWNKLEESKTIKIEPTQCTSLVDLFTRVLINGLDQLFKKGIDRGYVVHSEESRVLRGKLALQMTLKRNLLSRGQVHCEYDDLSYDVLHNQILKTTLVRLIRTIDIEQENRYKISDLARRLPEVRTVEMTKQMFGQVQLHRNNYIYDFLLRVCELIFDNLLPTDKAGAWHFRSFTRDQKPMAALFESFVRNFYRRELNVLYENDKAQVGRTDIFWKLAPGDEHSAKILPKMQTDVCLTWKSRRTIIECKYTDDPLEPARFEGGTRKLISQHLYQLNSYLDNLPDGLLNDQCRAILLYPVAARSLECDYHRPRGQRISIRTVNLMQDWGQIHDALLALVA